jgi:microcystin-dependent protein
VGEPFIAEIRIFSFGFAPRGWALCNGQLLPINQNQALFSLLGTTYGGNGQTNFALPDLRGRAPLHMGNGRVIGERAGEEAHTLIAAEMPAHTHAANAAGGSVTGQAPNPGGRTWGPQPAALSYASGSAALAPMSAQSVASTGGSQPHTNMQPYLVLSFCIALQGIFPPRN